MTKEEYIRLSEGLSQQSKAFQFFGLDDTAFAEINGEEEEYPGWNTHINDLIRRFCDSGMKVALGKYPKTGNVFVLPSDSNDIESDGVLPRQLMVRHEMNPEFIKLIFADRKGVS